MIFVLTTTTTQLIILPPCTCVWGNKHKEGGGAGWHYNCGIIIESECVCTCVLHIGFATGAYIINAGTCKKSCRYTHDVN